MNAYYKLYIKSVFRLALSIVIKSTITANRINERLKKLQFVVDPDDPFSWRYYMNMAGKYHVSNTMMQITSLDTQETIDFTIENLAVHRGTKREYTFGSRYFKDLKARFPDQEILIKGIINPIDMQTAIDSEDHNILSYDKTLVEPAEQNLIPQLQRFIDMTFNRWHNVDYDLFERYYYVGLLQTIGLYLAPTILNLRKAATKTDQAHSYHIRQYLMSFSAVGKEFDFLSKKQKLYFYRNIRYLNLNIGRHEIFDEVTQKVLTDRGFSLAKYELGHNYENLVEALDPEIELRRITVNGIEPAAGSNHVSVGEILDLERPLARDNPDYWEETHAEVTNKMEYSLFNKLPTKVFESNVLDLTDAEPFTLSEVLLNHWIYLSHHGRYKSVVTFTNPANGDTYKLSVKNAFIFYLYAYNASLGIVLDKVPVISANRVRRIPYPTWQELRSLTSDRKKVPDYYIDKVIDDEVPILTYVSTEAFREVCVDIHKTMLAHRTMRLLNQDFIAEGMLHKIVDRCYADFRMDLADGVTYEEWIDQQGIDISAMGKLEFGLIAAELFKLCTGGDLGNQTTTRQVHAAMVRLMRELSPYSVQFIATINDSPIKVIDGKFPTLTIPRFESNIHVDVEIPMPQILDIKISEHDVREVAVPVPCAKMTATATHGRLFVPVDARIWLKMIHSKAVTIEAILPTVELIPPEVVDIGDLEQQGIAGYLAIPSRDISDLITDNVLSGYEHLTVSRRQSLLRS